MTNYKSSADIVYKALCPRGIDEECLFGDRFNELENLALVDCVNYVKENIPQSEWRKGMNLIASEKTGFPGVRPNPLYVAMQEAESTLKAYSERKVFLQSKEDYSQIPEIIRPTMPKGLDEYAAGKISGLAQLVSTLTDPKPKGILFIKQCLAIDTSKKK